MIGRCVGPTNPFVEFDEAAIEQSIPTRFEWVVARYPERVAIRSRTQELTYAQLNRAANGVTKAILAHRVRGEGPVALLFEHDTSSIVAMLGVLKAGSFYVPLDPTFPHARLDEMLRHSQASLLLTNSRNVGTAEALADHRLELLDLDQIDPALVDENLALPLAPDSLAYILYTSGSTGRPKGVMQNHRNVLYVIRGYANALRISADDRVTFLYFGGVMGGVKDIFGTLLNGASLFPFDVRAEGLAGLANWLAREEITIYHSIPSLFRHLVDAFSGGEAFPKVRLISFGGEPVFKSDIERYKQYFSDACIVYCGLGSTELSGFRQIFVDKASEVDGNVVAAGYAVEGAETLLLDDEGREVGPDEVGKIAVRSRYATPGYWRDPELTRATFESDPNGGDERIYRTGDLGRMLPGDCLVHLGRRDFQVKIRGYRVQLPEIEAALRDLAGVGQAVVVAREGTPGDRRLVAYVVLTGQTEPTPSQLRSGLQARLPAYMVPSIFVLLDALPLTPSGKVDRLALPDPGRVRPELTTHYVAPRTALEDLLADIWAQVLGLELVGIEDPFLELGGDSLRATRIVSRVGDALQAGLPLRLLLEAPTVADQAAAILQYQLGQLPADQGARLLDDVEALSEDQTRSRLREGRG